MSTANDLEPRAAASHSGQWGLSAILVGGLVVISFPIVVMSMFGTMVGANSNDYLTSSDIDLGVTATYATVIGLLVLAIFALLCGGLGLLSALIRRQPLGLAIGGTVMSIVAVVLAVVLLMIALRSLDWTRDLQKRRFGPGGINRGLPIQFR